MATLRIARATSAGGVVHRRSLAGTQVLIVHRRRPLLWALPKGTPDSGETLEETALRETREETGIDVTIEAPIHAIRYVFSRGSTRFHKTVHFYLMRPIGGAIELHDAEFDEVRWAPASEALALLTHATERSVLERALGVLEAVNSTEAGV
ncbi:MAG: NUDIX hydrolase [Candidatus Limnocylindria bacterium]